MTRITTIMYDFLPVLIFSCGNHNKDEDNCLKTLNDKYHQASSQKFRQLYSLCYKHFQVSGTKNETCFWSAYHGQECSIFVLQMLHRLCRWLFFQFHWFNVICSVSSGYTEWLCWEVRMWSTEDQFHSDVWYMFLSW